MADVQEIALQLRPGQLLAGPCQQPLQQPLNQHHMLPLSRGIPIDKYINMVHGQLLMVGHSRMNHIRTSFSSYVHHVIRFVPHMFIISCNISLHVFLIFFMMSFVCRFYIYLTSPLAPNIPRVTPHMHSAFGLIKP